MTPVIVVKNVKKSFRVYHDKGYSLKEKLLFWQRNAFENREVLKGISFEVEKGEVLALIGKNGCGKSTTLKLLTRIMYPDEGSITMTGRVASLIELGAGFHPDMSGRENIYINASIFGLTKKEIDARLNDIITFSELEEFIDNPVRTYSSGMYMRLAFSVAINVDADILLIDEILAVGDANFQTKCFERLRELKAQGITIVIVTHDTSTVERFCNKAVWINDGNIIKYGAATEVVDQYLKYMNDEKMQRLLKEEHEKQKIEEEKAKQLENKKIENETKYKTVNAHVIVKELDYSANHFGLGDVIIEHVNIKNAKGEKTEVLLAGERALIEIFYKVNKPLENYVFGMGFATIEGERLYGNNTQIDRISVPHKKMNGKVTYCIENMPLLTGKYKLNVSIVDENGAPLDFYRDYCHIDVISNDHSVGIFSIQHKWIIE